jgi:hypothetical protein
MPRKQKKYHFIYKTTCNVTKRFYIGMHSTDNLDDGYLGSGTRLWYSINKYGKEKHVCKPIEFFNNRKKLKKRESEIVNEGLLKDPLCMNISLGGEGGFHNETHRKKFLEKSKKTRWGSKHNNNILRELWKNEEWSKAIKNKISEKLKGNTVWVGRKHSEKSKRKIGLANSITQKGERNSQYGTCWITNGKENKKIKKGEIILNEWRLGRKMK